MASAGGAPPAGAVAPILDVAAVEAAMHRHESRIVPQLQNVVATVNLGTKLDLKEIAMHARNAEYNPKRFAAVIMRIREPKTTALIFASGKMVCTGAKSEEDSRAASRRYAKIVQKLGFPVTFTEFKIQNIVGSCDVRFPIRLEGLACSHSLFASYEPELFPGLIYRMKQPKIVLLIFVSGKVVLTGAKTRAEIYQAFMNIYSTLMQFKKGDAGAAAAPLLPAPSAAMPPPRALPLAPTPSGPQGGAAPTDQQLMPPPMHLPPPTPMHGGLPPPTPVHSSLLSHPSYGGMHLPPPTPSHDGLPPMSPHIH